MTAQENEQKKLGHHFIIAMWVVAMVLIFFLFSELLIFDYNPNRTVKSSMTEDGYKTVLLQRNRYGHYVTQGKINQQDVTFMLDTGATDISIPAKLAKKLKLKRGPERYYQTANGTVIGYLTSLDKVSIGHISLTNVRAHINPNMGENEILLGMSFLKNIEFTQRGETLILRQY